MSSLNADFNELLTRIKTGRDFTHASFEPVYYLVFSPANILEVKRTTQVWLAKLKNDGWQPHVFSLTEAIKQIFEDTPAMIKKMWHEADARSPQQWEKTNNSLANAVNKGAIEQKLERKLLEIENIPNSILLVTDLEALHQLLQLSM